MKHFYTLLFALLITGLGFGQTAPGHIAFTAFNADGGDDFAIVTLVDIPANTEIYFTDNEPATATTLTTGEGTLLWDSGGSLISEGSIVVFTDASSGSRSASSGTLTSAGGSLNLAAGGDALYAFIGTSATAATAWLAGIQNESGNQGGGFGSTGLTAGTTFIDFYTSGNPDGGAYNGPRAGESSFSDYLSELGDNTNWTIENSNGENILPISTTAFTTGVGCTAPTTQASAYNTTSIGTTSATLNWTDGDGDEVLVLVKAGSAVDADPTNGTSYTGNTVFTSGDQIGTGNYVVQSGSATSSVSITGLTEATTYHVAVYEYNTTDTCYELTELTGDFTTDCSTPTDVTTFTATAGNTTVDLSWTNGSCFDEILVVAKASSAVTVTPTGDGTAYTANATFSSGTDLGTGEYAVYKGTGTSVTVTGLTNGTTYHFEAFARKITTWSSGVTNSATPTTAPVAGDIVISEIMYNSSSTDDEWIEIYNGSGSDITLDSDWRLTYNGSTFDFTSTVITSGSYITIALGSNGDGTFNNDNPFTPDVSVIGTPASTIDNSNNLVNSTATISVIYDPSGLNVTIDTVTYDDGSPWPTTPDGNGPSLELIDTASDNSLAASWDASDDDGGTPGTGYPITYTFTGTWSPSDPNGTATAGDDIVIASGNATIDTNTSANSVTVNAGASLTVDTGITLTTTNGLAMESTSTSYSSLILDGSITGTLTYERHVNINGSGTTGSNDLISAPLTGQQFDDFATANPNILNNGTLYLFGHFDKTTGDYVTYNGSATTTLDPGVGYRAASSDNDTFTFTGTANNGTVTNNITNSGPTEAEWNLVGNPYPSYINVQDFLNHEVDTGVKNINLFDSGTAAIYGYDGTALNGWTVYNLANTTPSTVIAPGQGFFVSADATNAPLYDLEFTPAMRSTGTTDDFIVGREAAGTFTKFTLAASTTNDSFSTEVYFNPLASLGFDFGFDTAPIGYPAFRLSTSVVEYDPGDPTELGIQTINTTDLADTTIPLGVWANQGEQITFTLTENLLPVTTEVYLDDTVAMTSTLLSTTDYIVTPTTNLTGTGRFFIRVFDETLSSVENTLNTLTISALNDTKEILVKGQLQEDTVLNLYDVQGRKVLSTQLDYTNLENRIDTSNLSGGIYVVTVKNNGQQKTQKVIIK